MSNIALNGSDSHPLLWGSQVLPDNCSKESNSSSSECKSYIILQNESPILSVGTPQTPKEMGNTAERESISFYFKA